jgi:hypothetical protein
MPIALGTRGATLAGDLPMIDANERLTRLIELATQSAPETQCGLAFEICDLLLDWPPGYPIALQALFEALLEKSMQHLDRVSRQIIVARLATRYEAKEVALKKLYSGPMAGVIAPPRKNQPDVEGNKVHLRILRGKFARRRVVDY